MTIVTLTPNPSVDRTLEIAHLARGEVLRAGSERVDAGGKGVNVARALAANGVATRAVLPLGGPEGQLLATLLDDQEIPVVPVAVGGSTRSNVTLGEPDGTVTKVNVPGQPLLDGEVERLLDACLADLAGVEWIVGCGSLPPGVPDYLYAALVERSRAAGVRVAIDTSGVPLAWAVEAGPDLVKPNLDELTALVGRPIPTLDEVIQAAEGLRWHGVGSVVVSLGARGAVLVDGDEPLLAVPRPIAVRSDVGAGDALLAGFLAAGAGVGAGADAGTGPRPAAGRTDALRAGVAWGAAAAGLPGTEMPGPAHIDLDAVTVQPAPGSLPLAPGHPDEDTAGSGSPRADAAGVPEERLPMHGDAGGRGSPCPRPAEVSSDVIRGEP